jgi:hypothetical protein
MGLQFVIIGFLVFSVILLPAGAKGDRGSDALHAPVIACLPTDMDVEAGIATPVRPDFWLRKVAPSQHVNITIQCDSAGTEANAADARSPEKRPVRVGAE